MCARAKKIFHMAAPKPSPPSVEELRTVCNERSREAPDLIARARELFIERWNSNSAYWSAMYGAALEGSNGCYIHCLTSEDLIQGVIYLREKGFLVDADKIDMKLGSCHKRIWVEW